MASENPTRNIQAVYFKSFTGSFLNAYMIKIKKVIAATLKSADSMDDAKFTFASAKNSDNDHSQFLNSKNLNKK